MSLRRPTLSTVAVALAAASFAVPSAALAKGGGGGGGGGGGTTPPPVVVDPIQCDTSQDGWQADGSYISTGPINDAGCLGIRQTDTSLSISSISAAPGWTYAIQSNGGGTNSRVQVTYTQTSTGKQVEVRIEFGKTRIS